MFNRIKKIDEKLIDTLEPKVRKIGVLNFLLILIVVTHLLMIIMSIFML